MTFLFTTGYMIIMSVQCRDFVNSADPERSSINVFYKAIACADPECFIRGGPTYF